MKNDMTKKHENVLWR